jgi:hypothetical protein
MHFARNQNSQSYILWSNYNGESIGTLYLALYGNILRSVDLWWLFGARYKDSISLNLKAVEMKRFVSYFSNFTRECLGSVHCVRCGFKPVKFDQIDLDA